MDKNWNNFNGMITSADYMPHTRNANLVVSAIFLDKTNAMHSVRPGRFVIRRTISSPSVPTKNERSTERKVMTHIEKEKRISTSLVCTTWTPPQIKIHIDPHWINEGKKSEDDKFMFLLKKKIVFQIDTEATTNMPLAKYAKHIKSYQDVLTIYNKS